MGDMRVKWLRKRLGPRKFDRAWLDTPAGRRLLAGELRVVRSALAALFGDQLLQIGDWAGHAYVRSARTRRAAVAASRPGPGVDLVTQGDRLGIASDSIDAVLIAHALETNSDPHGLLREVDRVLRPDGQLVVLCFNPHGVWGMRHVLARQGFPPGVGHLISEHRLRDWLRLLNYRIDASRHYHFHLPVMVAGGPARSDGETTANATASHKRKLASGSRIAGLAERVLHWSPFAACYVVSASKEMLPLTPMRSRWPRRPRLVGGLVNPTTRNAA